MRGIVQLPEMITSRWSRVTRRTNGMAHGRGAPEPAARSQTDAVGLAQFAMSLRAGRSGRSREAPGLVLPVRTSEQEDHQRQTFIGKGQFLVRQEQWDTLGQTVREADLNRETTADGAGMASLLAQGARADFVQAARSAFAAGAQLDPAIIDALDEAIEEDPECWGIAAVVAQTHIDIGLASLGTRRPTSRPPTDDPTFRFHFDRAAELLDPFCAIENNSALLAEARCDLLLGAPDASDRVADDYEDLIDLDPGNPRHMRQLGLRLLPRWFGSYEELDARAHDTAERTEDIWGEGGYTWTWFDVLRAVPESAERLDLERYLEGLQDILDRRGTQHVVNLFAAHTGVVMDPTCAPDDLPKEAVRNRARINDCFTAIVDERLRELHPRHWAEAQQSPFTALPDIDALADDGEAIARSLISRLYAEELSAGQIVAFTPAGIELQPQP